ncbi:head-tail adaptor protein [Pseudomonas sp. NBRC 111131]|uniref:head-tail adaptor protein n=1 Tax=Pseudomonas sp. NBRC 111131 TaxID=1661046 RepID=UPI0009EA5442|nr:head-tail adaptor protein [Pseudomonas sp. NBRC 111131]
MRAGPLRHRCRLSKYERVQNDTGGYDQEWVPAGELWTEITIPTGRTQPVAERLEATVSAEIRIRPRSDIAGRVRKYKGTADAGDLTLTVGLDNGDAGQNAVKTAHKDRSKGDYNIKITLNDGDPGATPALNPTTFYMRGKVMNNTVAPGAADNVVRRNITIGINSDILELVPAPAA